MKRNCYTRLMALLLAVVMLLAMTACGEGAVSETAAQTSEPYSTAPETPETPDAPETSQEDVPQASAEETGETANIFPLEETETFSLYYPWSPRFVELGYSSPNDFTFFPALEALTNVHIDFTAVGADVFSESFLLMMATQDYTDMYFNCTASYNGGISKANLIELGQVQNTPTPVVNNGVIVTVGSDSVWTVTGTCCLSALNLCDGGVMAAPEGKTLSFTVNGEEMPLCSGKYRGDIRLTIA